VWTNQRIIAWRERGERPVVAVWTVQQLSTFRSQAADDRLSAMWWLIALRGLRRGEAAGLRWCDIDLDAGTLTIEQQRIAFGRTVHVGPPKTAASRRTLSPSIEPPSGCCASIAAGSRPSGTRPATSGRTPATSSPLWTVRRGTRTG